MQIHKIRINLSSVVSVEPESDVPCGSCTLCCQLLSPYLTPQEISSGLYPISLVQPDQSLKTVDPEVGPVVTIYKNPAGGCSLFIDGKCSIYEHRPLACRQFDCRKGHHPKTSDRGRELMQESGDNDE